ncbi:uncharacterized protein TNCV_4585871 [Trichonephila clavipes]|nr:uncharacterized protein TNCV_4585871 [Trichonephila clavipes]
MTPIVRHDNESVRGKYIRNVGKEVKLFASVLQAFQCNNRIVMTQRTHFDDFIRGKIIGHLKCGRTQLEVSEELEIGQSVISRRWQSFQYDGYVRCYSTGPPPRVATPNKDRCVWQLLPKETDSRRQKKRHSNKPVSSAIFLHWYDSFKTDCIHTLRTDWSIRL